MCPGGGRVAPSAGCPAHVLAQIPGPPAAVLFRRCKRSAYSNLRRVAPGARRSSRREPVERPRVSKEMPRHPLELLRLEKSFSGRGCFHGAQIAHPQGIASTPPRLARGGPLPSRRPAPCFPGGRGTPSRITAAGGRLTGPLRAPHRHRPDVTPSLSVPVRNPVTPTTIARRLTTRPDGVDQPEAILL